MQEKKIWNDVINNDRTLIKYLKKVAYEWYLIARDSDTSVEFTTTHSFPYQPGKILGTYLFSKKTTKTMFVYSDVSYPFYDKLHNITKCLEDLFLQYYVELLQQPIKKEYLREYV